MFGRIKLGNSLSVIFSFYNFFLFGFQYFQYYLQHVLYYHLRKKVIIYLKMYKPKKIQLTLGFTAHWFPVELAAGVGPSVFQSQQVKYRSASFFTALNVVLFPPAVHAVEIVCCWQKKGKKKNILKWRIRALTEIQRNA